jgi:hypothetical protein
MNPEFRAYVAALRARQGLPPTIEDVATLERVAAVFRVMSSPADPPKTTPTKRRRKPEMPGRSETARTVVAR